MTSQPYERVPEPTHRGRLKSECPVQKPQEIGRNGVAEDLRLGRGRRAVVVSGSAHDEGKESVCRNKSSTGSAW